MSDTPITEIIATRLDQLADAVTEHRWSEFSMRVPAEPNRDADLVLSAAAIIIRDLAVTAERDALHADARRYRWLRDRTDCGSCLGVWRETPDGNVIEGGWLAGKELETAIDTAIAKEPKP